MNDDTIISVRGGTTAMRNLLKKLQELALTGHIIVNSKDGSFEGIVGIVRGTPKFAYAKDGGEFFGQRAYRKIWEVSYDKDASLVVHKKAHPIFERLGSKAQISPPKSKAKIIALTWGKKERAGERTRREELERKMEMWREKGYNVSMLESAMSENIENAEKVFRDYEKMVEELNELKNRVLSIKNTEYSYLVRDIEKYLNDPGKIDEIKIALRDAELKIQEKMAEEIRKKEEIKERERQKEMLYELLAKAGEVGGVETGKAEIGKEEIKLEASISPTYTFNNFVVGEFNRFAYAAAKAVAEKPGTVYNPLFIWSGPGLGKTHLLNAIANYIKDNNPDMKVLYTTTEKFSNDLIEALQNNKLLSFRQKYRNVDVLIVDDVQFLAGRERTQEEFFHTFNTLFTVDKQIVLACDRPPKDIPSLEQRLVSRFEGGLIAQITPPDFESRVAILRQKAKENGWTVEDDVLNYIAQHFENNIRELEGALKKVMAFASLMKTKPTLELAKEVLKDVIGEREKEAIKKGKVELKGGQSYLIEEERGDECFRLFSEYTKSRKGLCISRKHPLRLSEKYGIENADLYWLTDRESKAVKTVNYVLERLDYIIEDFIENNSDGVILLDGLTYLTNNNSFDAVLNFIRRIIDVVYETNCIFMVSVTPQTIEEQELKILEREMEVLDFMPK